MKTEKFTLYDAVMGIDDIRYIIAIMFNTTDLLFIKKVLNKSGYPFGSPDRFANQLNEIHERWIKNNKDIDKVKGYFGMCDPFDKVELSIMCNETNNINY